MAERTSKSAGVTTREIDLSFATTTGPTGIPSGVIGTAESGPAFVPVTVANFRDFMQVFGPTNGERFGPLAVFEWLRKAQSLTYVRVLGCGDGKQRNSTGNNTGNVTNAGFVAGAKQIQPTGLVGVNPYANTHGPLGRTHLLGCFMSQSAGSTIFSAAGIQDAASVQAAVYVRVPYADNLDDGNYYQMTDTRGVTTKFMAESDNAVITRSGDGTKVVTFGVSDTNSAIKLSKRLYYAFLTASNAGWFSGSVSFPTTAGLTHASAQFKITQDYFGPGGSTSITTNGITLAELQFSGAYNSSSASFDGGAGAAVPILRGMILAASGVVPMLSGGFTNSSNVPGATARATAAGPKGSLTGTVNLTGGEQNFVLLLNGHKDTSSGPNIITCSFDMDRPHYFGNVLNKDPYKLEEKGHYLYASWDVHPGMAVVTGSGVLTPGTCEARIPDSQDAAILTTGSLTRNLGNSYAPNFDSFEDRFAHAESPSFISQKFGGKRYNLFKVHALSDGATPNTQYKISIENITPSTSDTYKFGTFDLVVRDFYDVDTDSVALESFRGLTLDPTSQRYVARAIGDKYTYFDFDKKESSQKIITAGDHSSRSRYIRVKMSDVVKADQVPDEALPIGFRGPRHMVTSGSVPVTGLGSSAQNFQDTDNCLKRLTEVPIPMRESLSIGTNPTKRVVASLHWGVQFERKTSPSEPNSNAVIDNSFKAFSKYFPSFQTSNVNVSVGDNAGKADSSGTVLDSDRFNKNLFSLENVSVRTGSDGKADVNYWVSASYVRDGNISTSATNKTRAFKVSDLSVAGNRRFSKFTAFLQGGFDGLDIFNKDKYNMVTNAARREMTDSTTQGGTAGPTVASYRQALDVMGNKTDVDIKVLAIPGIRHESITDYAIDVVESRFDAIYIMDLEDYDVLGNVVTSSAQDVSVTNTVSSFTDRALDTSFASAYFPDVVMTDPLTNTNVRVPPSVQVLGSFALNDAVGHPWFAPAGFARGALGGVIETNVRFNKSNLDTIYDADINPITAPVVGRGYVVWGQKTLLRAQSALDRVNVRRLLIEIRRRVRAIANSLLFEPNRASTLSRFESLVNPVLQSVQDRSGLDRYKVVIDTTTTTQADVENNTIRGKIFLQPTRTAEFISLDFVVTNAGQEV